MAGSKKNRVAEMYCQADDLLKELRAELGVGARVVLTSGDRGNCEIIMKSKRGRYTAKSKTFTACLANAIDVVKSEKASTNGNGVAPRKPQTKKKPAAKRAKPVVRRRRVPA